MLVDLQHHLDDEDGGSGGECGNINYIIHMILSLSWERTGLGLGEGRDLPNKVVVILMVVTMMVMTMMVMLMTHDT